MEDTNFVERSSTKFLWTLEILAFASGRRRENKLVVAFGN